MNVEQKIEQVFNRLPTANRVVYDAETSGLSWQRNHTVGHVLTFGPGPEDTYYLPVRHAPGGNIEGVTVPQDKEGWTGEVHPLEIELMKQLDRTDLLVEGHNLGFDLKFMCRLGYKFKAKYQDSQLNAVLIDEFQQSVSLDFCAKVAQVQAKKVTIYDYLASLFPEIRANPKTAMGHFWRLAGDDPQAVEYAEGDGTSTWQVIDWQAWRLAEQGLMRVHDIECRLIPVLAKMTTRGVRIDEERLHEVKREVITRRDEALRALPPEFNSRAPTQVRALMEVHGHTDWPLTPKGSPSFTEAFLKTNEIGRKIVAARQYNHLLSSFVEPMIETHLWNGRVHPEYNQLRGDEFGTITGRLSSSNPNLQQIPKRNRELSLLYRSIFLPDDGKVWGSVDYSQCEPRLLAYYSGCRVLTEGYKAVPSVDAHTAVAVSMYKSKGWDDWSKDEKKAKRENAKRVNQTLVTGGGKGVIVEKYGVDPKEVDQIWSDYFGAMPEIKVLQNKASNRMRRQGFVYSLLGRRARLRDANKAYVATNRLLQLGNADILKQKAVEINDYIDINGIDVQMLNNCHDAFDFQFPESEREHYEEIKRIMIKFGPDDAIPLTIPMEVDAGEGRNWSEATWGVSDD